MQKNGNSKKNNERVVEYDQAESSFARVKHNEELLWPTKLCCMVAEDALVEIRLA